MSPWNFTVRIRRAALALAVASAALPATADWSPSWMSATQLLWHGDFVLPLGLPFQYRQQTIRQVARLSIGGAQLRVVLSNEGNAVPLQIGAARVARHARDSATEPGTDRPLLFEGPAVTTVPPGARWVSDPVDLPLPALAKSRCPCSCRSRVRRRAFTSMRGRPPMWPMAITRRPRSCRRRPPSGAPVSM